MKISIKEITSNEFQVTINSNSLTTHNVILTDEVHKDLTDDKVTKVELLDFSFQFLLDREPNTSILSSFELTVISRYFPEYKQSVRNWCSN
tara:strand:- start:290 stop:562 length:273 start_codon:yes stop_codon:yes gene_type:complete